MDWSNERYVRLYTRDTTDWIMWPWQARAVFALLLRKVDRSGVLPLGKHGLRGLCVTIGLPPEVVEPGIQALLEDGCVIQNSDVLVMPNFLAAQEAPMSDKERARKKREKERANALGHAESHGVTPSHADTQNVTQESQNVTDQSQSVTESHELSRGVTPSHAASRGVTLAVPIQPIQPNQPSRAEETTLSAVADGAAPLPQPEPIAQEPKPDQLAPQVRQVFEHWKRVMGKGRTQLDDKRRRAVLARLKGGYTVEDLCKAIDGCAKTPHNMGENERATRYDDLELICRDASHVDRFMHNATSPPKPPGTAHDPRKGVIRAEDVDWSQQEAGYVEVPR